MANKDSGAETGSGAEPESNRYASDGDIERALGVTFPEANSLASTREQIAILAQRLRELGRDGVVAPATLATIVTHPVASELEAEIDQILANMPANAQTSAAAARWLSVAPSRAARILVAHAARLGPYWTPSDLDSVVSEAILEEIGESRDWDSPVEQLLVRLNTSLLLDQTSWGRGMVRERVASALEYARSSRLEMTDITGLGGYIEGEQASVLFQLFTDSGSVSALHSHIDTILEAAPEPGVRARQDDAALAQMLQASLPTLDLHWRSGILGKHAETLVSILGAALVRDLVEQVMAERMLNPSRVDTEIVDVANMVGSPVVRRVLGPGRAASADVLLGRMLWMESQPGSSGHASEAFAALFSQGAQDVVVSEATLERLSQARDGQTRALPVLHAWAMKIVSKESEALILEAAMHERQGRLADQGVIEPVLPRSKPPLSKAP